MAYQPKPAAAGSNTIKISFDPDTWDRLKARAGTAKDTMERVAYRMILAALAADPPKQTPAEPEPAGQDLSAFPAFRRDR